MANAATVSMTDSATDLDKQSLRGFLAQVARELPDEILRVREPVSTRLDITSLVYELERMGRNPPPDPIVRGKKAA